MCPRLAVALVPLLLVAAPDARAEEAGPPRSLGDVVLPAGLSTFVIALVARASGLVVPRSEAAFTSGAREARPHAADPLAPSTEWSAMTAPRPPPLYTTLIDVRF